ncbi:MAG: electron transporter [Burkholderiaceae bacterium]|nr:electron transporter [Burkholderiaceae bacterium]
MNRFVIAEPKLCIGCNTCMAACTLVHKAEGLQSHPRLNVVRNGTATAPVQCRNCEDAPCAKVCPVNAITQSDDAVVLNEVTCIGCKLCAIACPFGAITPSGTSNLGVATQYNQLEYTGQQTGSLPGLDPILSWSSGVRSVAVKCDLCDFSGKGPECVRVCPTKALFLVSEEAINESSSAKRKATVIADGANLSFVGIDSEQK